MLMLSFSAALLGGKGMCAQNSGSNALARLGPVPLCESLVAAAQANQIPLERIDPQGETNRLDPGDSITALIALFEKGRQRSQWLVYLEVVSPDAKESAENHAPSMVLYSSFGGTQKCVSASAFVVVRTLGPFADSPARGKSKKVPEKSARFALNKGFLALGLHHAAAAFRRFDQRAVHGTWAVSHAPFSEEKLAEGRKLAEKLQLTVDEERSLIATIPALLSYFEVVQNTPGLSDILYDIVDLPSAWSLIRNAGIKSVGIHFRKGIVEGKSASWGLPESAPIYLLPLALELNQQTALNLTFVVTRPDPPLLACAGVVGLLAEKPDDPQKYLTLRVLSARAGGQQ